MVVTHRRGCCDVPQDLLMESVAHGTPAAAAAAAAAARRHDEHPATSGGPAARRQTDATNEINQHGRPRRRLDMQHADDAR